MSKPMSPGATDAHDRVQVGAVVVERRADVVDDLGDLLDRGLEQAQRDGLVSIRQATSSVGLGPQVVEVDVAALVGADLDHLVAGHRHRRRVGAVGGVGRQDLGPLLAAVLVEGARQQHARELAVRARPRAAARRAAARRSRPARPAGATSARAPPGRGAGPGAGAAWRGRAAPRPARGAWGCASSCTSRAGRSPCRGRSCASRAGCSGARSRARRPRAARALAPQLGGEQLVERALGYVERRGDERAAPGPRALVDRQLVIGGRRSCATPAPRQAASAATAAPSTSARRSMSARVRCSVIATSRPSSCSG